MKSLVLAALLVATSAQAAWTQVSSTGTGSFGSVDVSTIKRLSPTKMKAWVFWQYETASAALPGQPPVWAVKNLTIFDCKNEQVQNVASMGFDNKEGDGSTVFSNQNAEGGFRDLSPDSMGMQVLQFVCKQKVPAAKK